MNLTHFLVYLEQDDWGNFPDPPNDDPDQIYLTIRYWDERKNEMKDFVNLNCPQTFELGKTIQREREREGRTQRRRNTQKDRETETRNDRECSSSNILLSFL